MPKSTQSASDAAYDWLSEHREELRKLYPNQWVAVTSTGVLAVGGDGGDMMARVARSGTDPSDLAVAYLEMLPLPSPI